MVSGLQGEKWKFIQKYMKKNIQNFRSQISGSTKDHFAGENKVCEISQAQKGLRNYFAAKGWFRTAAKLAFIL